MQFRATILPQKCYERSVMTPVFVSADVPQKEADTRCAVNIMHKCRRDRANTKSKGNGREPPSRTDPFAHQITWDFKDNIRDKEDREHFVVIIAHKAKILVEASQLGVSCSGVSRLKSE